MSALRRTLELSALPLSGVHLIEASAGTGKTYTLAALILRLVVERELPIEQILAVTFTTAATLELRARVLDRLESARRHFAGEAHTEGDLVLSALGEKVNATRAIELLERALGNFDRASIHTIHGFAARALGENAFELGARLDLEVTPQMDEVIYDSVADFWAERVATLELDAFRPLQKKLFEDLRRVARLSVSSREVPWVKLDDTEALLKNVSALVLTLNQRFDEARDSFERQGTEARDLLLSGAVNRNSYPAGKVQSVFDELKSYFEADEAEAELSEPCERWTQSAVRRRLNKGKSAEHRVFVQLEALWEVRLELALVIDARRALLFREARDYMLSKIEFEHSRARTQSFDDLLVSLKDALYRQGTEGSKPLMTLLTERYRVALIDEFQDTDAVQYSIFRKIFVERAEPSLFLIGDPKQSIYAFRGADIFSYLAAQKEADSVWTMPFSYRSSPSVVGAQNALLGRGPSPFLFEDIRYEAMQSSPGREDRLLTAQGSSLPGMAVIECDGTVPILTQAALEIARMLEEGLSLAGEPLSARHFVLLCRTNAQAEQAQQALARLGISAVMHGDRSVFESVEAKELRAALRGLIEPGDREAVRSALATRLFGLDVNELVELEKESERLDYWTQVVRGLSETWRKRGIFATLERIFVELGATERLLSEVGGERKVTNLRHLSELLHAEEVTRHMGPLALFRFLEAAVVDPLTFGFAPETRQIRLESDADAVILTTVHKSKGLEYDIVILPTLGDVDKPWDEPAFRFHDSAGDERIEVRSAALAPESHEARSREHYAESLRLGYVALTRARHHVRVLLSPFKKGFSSFRYWCSSPAVLTNGSEDALAAMEGHDASAHKRFLVQLVEASHGTIDNLHPARAEERQIQTTVSEESLHFVPLSPSTALRLERTRRTGSFSSIARSQRFEARKIGRDVADAEGHTTPAVLLPPALEVGALEFPRGADAGEAIHLVFEKMPFERDATEERRILIRDVLRRSGFDLSYESTSLALVERSLQTELPTGFALCELKPEERAPEREFNLVAGNEARELDARGLLSILASAPELPESYRRELHRLEFPGWRGYLRGFIDLTIEKEGKLYVVDYKSNFLGSDEKSYEPPALERSMAEHHYFMQGLLYAAAVHAHARARRANYDFDAQFGGVLYLFLRGMKPEAKGSGAYFLRPSLNTLEGILRVLGGGAA